MPALATPVEERLLPADANVRSGAFEVHLGVFNGPFDLLLGLISKHKLDITEVALAQVTDEFVAYIRAMPELDLDELTDFLVIAATLLDLKAARLLPSADVDDEEDLALLEARDLLFARLLEYRAYKDLAGWIAVHQSAESEWHPRLSAVPEEFAASLPQVLIDLSPEEFARIAAIAMTPKEAPVVQVDHIHAIRVSVPEHMAYLTQRLLEVGSATFRAMCADCSEVIEVVARFLAVLELYREGSLALDQASPLGELHLRWVARD
jgi:segregation and condensation protein A